ncbi:O-antigen ligase family protein [Pseudonocardia ailaonensis]|uniref:O-antigen ligase family protein n=1 Tax=Pseudonocardia ailaonensis TaxID=367279 RepID=UPI0031DF9E73
MPAPRAPQGEAPPAVDPFAPSPRRLAPLVPTGALGWGAVGLGVLTGATALVAGVMPALLVLGVFLAAVVGLYAVRRPAIALIFLVAGEFSDAGQVLASNGIPSVYNASLLLGALSIMLALFDRDSRARLRTFPWLPAALLGVYLLSEMPGVFSSVAPDATSSFVADQFKDALFLVIVLGLARLVTRPWWVAAALVLPIAVICGFSVVNQVFLGGSATATFGGFATISAASGEAITTPRYAGPLPDSNFWGRYLVLALPCALALMRRAVVLRRGRWVLLWALCTVLTVAGMYLTQSRGTLLACAMVLVLWFATAGPRMRRLGLILSPVVLLLLFVPGVGNRLVNLDAAFDNQPAYAIDPSIVERTAAQKIALLMFEDHPVVGLGPGAFGSAVPDYASRSNGLLIGTTRAPHNLYLQLLAEAGIVGLAGWIVLMGGMVLLALRIVLRLARARGPDSPERVLAAALLTSVLGWSLASLFLHVAYFRTVLVVLAVIGLLDVLTRPATAAGRRAEWAAVRAASRRVAATVVGAGVAAAVVVGVAVGLFGQESYTARSSYTLMPAPGTYEAYSLDVRSRISVLPAFAGVVGGAVRSPSVVIEAEPANGLITLTATGSSADDARGRLAVADESAGSAVARFGLDRGFRIIAVSPPAVTVERVYPTTVLAGAVVAWALVVGLGSLLLRRFRRSRPVPPPLSPRSTS